jgi:hypothetical protein
MTRTISFIERKARGKREVKTMARIPDSVRGQVAASGFGDER